MFINKLRLISTLLAAGLLVVGAALGVGRARDGDDTDPPPPLSKVAVTAPADDPPRAPVVRVTKPQPGALDRLSDWSCVAEPSHKVTLVPEVTGVLKRVNADIGDRVKAGQLLAEIDAPALVLDERQAAVGVAQAEAGLKEAEARVATAKAEIEAAKVAVMAREADVARAKGTVTIRKQQFDLTKSASGGGGSMVEVIHSQEQLHLAEGLAEAAAVGVASAKTNQLVKESMWVQAVAAVGTARQNIEAAKIGLDRARLAVAHTRITAPFDGVVAQRGCSAGQHVRPGERSEEPLFTVMRTDVVRVWFPVSQGEQQLIEPGQEATVNFGSTGGTGKVTRVGATLDPRTVTLRVEIDLPNPKGDIRPGAQGRVTVKRKGPADALRVPAGAVFALPQAKPDDLEKAVYVYKGGKARATRVAVSHQNSEEAEIVWGLTAEDQVVTDPKGLVPRAEIAVEIENSAPKK
ncbi:hypothetical protein FTUN_5702 [Frigoriglobus tundricola]|uniref:Uncharacterized protein n=2 Tax=Frigoriglobus tundricola TaxID=2774151 RepID=A0A6M5YYY3_9BACT|nr:hypothetical protein FTUN_5702 [Frigoriglobus tundricola]